MCGDPELGRDLVQEVLVRAFERWDQIGVMDRPAAYLMRMTTNEFLSWRRRWSTRHIVHADADTLDRAAGPTADHGEHIAIRDDLERRSARSPPPAGGPLLRFYAGFDYPESAELMGCAEGTVRSACSRGLATLRLNDDRSRLLTRLDVL